jgi:allantoinase
VTIYRNATPKNRITIETCPHYLTLNASDIPDAKTEFKTTPPIRDADNQRRLLEALKAQQIDMVTSAHSSTLPGIKCTTYGKTRGDFLRAWSGIASIQYTLPVMWTYCSLQPGLTVTDLVRVLCEAPAELYGISREKSRIAEGYDADFCVWAPDEEFLVHKDSIQHQIKSSPYVDRRLKGVVHATVLRGCLIYEKDTGIGPKEGRLILKRDKAKKKMRAIKFKDELEEHDD